MPNWIFQDTPDTAVTTTKSVLDGVDWIQDVFHDSADGMWEFHPSKEAITEDNVKVVSLAFIVQIDPSVEVISDLPVGWRATRHSKRR